MNFIKITLFSLILFAAGSSYAMKNKADSPKKQNKATSSLMHAFSAGTDELNKHNYWLAIHHFNTVFELSHQTGLKAIAAIHLGTAYKMVDQPATAEYFFSFAANQKYQKEAQKFAKKQLHVLAVLLQQLKQRSGDQKKQK